MSLIKEFKTIGTWLFRYRSYIPLLILPLLIKSLYNQNDYPINIYLYFGLAVSFSGQIIRLYTVGSTPKNTSGRNYKKQLAETLNTTGIYSIVRHPLYLGNYLMYLGPFIYTSDINSILIFSLLFWIYYERIMIAEEAFLISKFSDSYHNWSIKTPAFIPNFSLFKSNNNFSYKKAILGEYSGICGLILIFLFSIYFKYLYNCNTQIPNILYIIFIINIFLYICLRSIKKFYHYKKYTI